MGSNQPAEPVELVPLPPASGTPIGILLDDAAALALTDAQLDELRAIDRDLAYRMEQLDAGDASGGAGQGGPPVGGRPRGRGGRGGGGMSGGPMGGGGGMGASMPGGGGPGLRGGMGPPSSGPRPDVAGPPPPASAAHHDLVRDAFTRAFAILDDKQVQIAWDLLVARDLDPAAMLEASAGTRSPASPMRER